MKKKPTSAKKHKELRRVRRTDWNKSREDMEKRDRMADDAAHEFIKEIVDIQNKKINQKVLSL